MSWKCISFSLLCILFWIRIIAIDVRMHFRIQEGSYIPASSSIIKNIIFGKNKIGIK